MNDIKTQWTRDIFKPYHGKTILVLFRGYKEWEPFPAAMIEEMKTDPEIVDIVDNETGEVIYSKPDPRR